MTGLKRGVVRLAAYDSSWKDEFEKEKLLLESIFNESAEAIEHVGSTAVPGLSAKPIIDIEIGLKNFNDWQKFVRPLEDVGYTFMPERQHEDMIFLPKGPESKRTRYLHITGFNSEEWRKVIKFRDALRRGRTLREEYDKLKYMLAEKYPDDRKAYSDGKLEFIRKVIG